MSATIAAIGQIDSEVSPQAAAALSRLLGCLRLGAKLLRVREDLFLLFGREFVDEVDNRLFRVHGTCLPCYVLGLTPEGRAGAADMIGRMGTHVYLGRDFALDERKDKWCSIRDDGKVLSFSFPETPSKLYERCAVDCPFGIPVGFNELLHGTFPAGSDDHYQTRATERWARSEVAGYRAVASGLGFHRGRHVRPATALSIVPGCIYWIAGESKPEKTEKSLQIARRGEGKIVEAHPRLFLYSAVERIFRAEGSLSEASLQAVSEYKHNDQDTAINDRREAFRLLLTKSQYWVPRAMSEAPPGAEDLLVKSDHLFDAWLAALTAWAHAKGETVHWKKAGLTGEIVNVEGHISILDQEKHSH